MDEEMPRSKSPKMIEIRFTVPATYVGEAEAIAAFEGRSIASLHRLVWEKGFALHAENVNKILVNQRLRLKLKKPPDDELGASAEDDEDDD